MAIAPNLHPRVKVVLDRTHEVLAGLDDLVNQAVFVGVPSTRAERRPDPDAPDPPSNAVIGYVQENGDPELNIPPRPFLVPGVKSVQPAIVARLRAIGRAALDGDRAKVASLRNQLGLLAQRAVQQKITDGPFTPLSEATLKARAERRNKGAAGSRKGARAELARRAAGLPAGTDLARPLIDTGQLRRAITYVIGPTRRKKTQVKAYSGTYFTS